MNAVESIADPVVRLEHELRRDIPLARMMDVRVAAWDGESITLTAPAGPNINDKGCAFGGSLASLLTIAGWAFASLNMRGRGLGGDVYVQDSQIRYLAPVFGELRATARLAHGESLEVFFSTLAARGRARLGIQAEVAGSEGQSGTTMQGRYVAFNAAKSC